MDPTTFEIELAFELPGTYYREECFMKVVSALGAVKREQGSPRRWEVSSRDWRGRVMVRAAVAAADAPQAARLARAWLGKAIEVAASQSQADRRDACAEMQGTVTVAVAERARISEA